LKKDVEIPNKWTAVCDASNDDSRPVSALMMVYVRASDAVRNNVSYPVPLRALRAFDRAVVDPGAMNLLSAEITLHDLMLVNNDGQKEAARGRHFDILDIWDGWDAFASYSVSIDFDSLDKKENVGGVLKTH
jgi:hypothetical protein